MIRKLAVISFMTLTVPASATMPNSDSEAWSDHSRSIRIGADIAPRQHATITLSPEGGGKFDFDMRCENDRRGSTADGTLHLLLLAGEQVLKTIDQPFQVHRSEFAWSQRVTNYHQELDLSDVINRVTSIKLSAETHWAMPEYKLRPPIYGAVFREPGQ